MEPLGTNSTFLSFLKIFSPDLTPIRYLRCMAAFLNRQRRQSFSSGGGAGSYLGYAIGEIILVTLGILIALYIKDWHSEQQQEKAINRAATLVIEDLRRDTALIHHLQKQYQPRKKYYTQIIADSMPIDSLRNCPVCPYLITTLSPFKPSGSGYLVLQKFEIGLQSPRDSLLHRTRLFYQESHDLFLLINDFLSKDVSNTLNYWTENHPWYSKWVKGEVSEAMYRYMAKDPLFKNRVANHYLILYRNYLNSLETYQAEATQLADRWEELLAKE